MEILVESAQAIARFLREQGYTEERLSELGLAELPWNSLARQSVSAWLVMCDPRLELLIRAFYLGEAVKTSQAEKLFSKEILRDLLESELLARDGERLRPACMLTHRGADYCLRFATARRNGRGGGSGSRCKSDDAAAGQVQHTPTRKQSVGSWHRLRRRARTGSGSLRCICAWAPTLTGGL